MNKDGSTKVTHSNTYAALSRSYHSTNWLCVLLMLHLTTSTGSITSASVVNEISQPWFTLSSVSADMSF